MELRSRSLHTPPIRLRGYENGKRRDEAMANFGHFVLTKQEMPVKELQRAKRVPL